MKIRFNNLLVYLVLLVLSLLSDAKSTGKNLKTKNRMHTMHKVKRSFSPGNGKLRQAKNNEDEDAKICWMELDISKHFQTMDALDGRFADVRRQFQSAVGTDGFDNEMLKVMIQTQGASDKQFHKAGGFRNQIPAGLNLGGCNMMRMPNSILFFHRLKLRNDTQFTVTDLHNNLEDMALNLDLRLNDLQLLGSYERAITAKDPSSLFYRPTFGNIMFLLRNVKYSMEGRYRLVQDKLMIENIVSKIEVPEVLMNYAGVNGSATGTPESLPSISIEEFIDKIRLDMDKWLKHYFNDYLLYFELGSAGANSQLRDYDVSKAFELNKYVDNSLSAMKNRLYDLKCVNVKIPNFQIYAINGMQIKLRDGVVRGLDSMHRRSVATGQKLPDGSRKVNVVIGFSNLKVEYKYDAVLSPGSPPMHGMFILTADDLTAGLEMALTDNPEFAQLKFEFLEQPKPESLVVEGSMNRRIANIRHLVESQIITLMSNMLYHIITMLKTLTWCEPKLIPHLDPGDEFDGNDDDINNKDKDKPAYAANREDSIEILVPDKPGQPLKRMKIKYGENFALLDLGEDKDGATAPPDGNDQANTDVVNRSDEGSQEITPNDGRSTSPPGPALPYGLTRDESAEVIIDDHGKPKNIHIKYKEVYQVDQKNTLRMGAPAEELNKKPKQVNSKINNNNVKTLMQLKPGAMKHSKDLNVKQPKSVPSKIVGKNTNQTQRKKTVRNKFLRNRQISKNNNIARSNQRKKEEPNKIPNVGRSSQYSRQRIHKMLRSEQKKAPGHGNARSQLDPTLTNTKTKSQNNNQKLSAPISKVNKSSKIKVVRRNFPVKKDKVRNIPAIASLLATETPLVADTNPKTQILNHVSSAHEPQKARNGKRVSNNNSPTVDQMKIVQERNNQTRLRIKKYLRIKPNHEVSTTVIPIHNESVTPLLAKNTTLPLWQPGKNKIVHKNKLKSKSQLLRLKGTNQDNNNKSLHLQSGTYKTINQKPLKRYKKLLNGSVSDSAQVASNMSQVIKQLQLNKKAQFIVENKIKLQKTQNLSTIKRRKPKVNASSDELKLLRKPKVVKKLLQPNKTVVPKRKSDDYMPLRSPSGTRSNDPRNYAMEKHDSAEVILPAEPGKAPKTVHLDSKQNFQVQEKEGSSPPISVNSADNDGKQPTDEVDNRELNAPSDGPRNYAMEKHDSAEVILPAEPGKAPKTVHLDYKQNFQVQEKEGYGSPISEELAVQEKEGQSSPISEELAETDGRPTDKLDDRELDAPSDGPRNYAMEKHDSAEVILPAEPGKAPKTVHLEQKQQFEVQEKQGSNNSGNKPSEDVNDRELESPTEGPINYAMEKHDSAEVVLPAQPGEVSKTVHIEHKQKFEVQEKEGGNSVPSEITDDQSGKKPSEDVDNRELEGPTDSQINYAMEKHDSAEVVLPAQPGEDPKTVHIEHKQKFEVQEKEGGNSVPTEISDDQSGNKQSENVDDRELVGSTDGPINYAMEKHDSAEVVLPAQPGEDPKTVHIEHKQKFEVQEKEGGNADPSEISDDQSANKPSENVDDRELESPTDGPINYAMEKHDSAEVVLPAEPGKAPKTVHIEYKQKFEIQEKEGSNSRPNEISDDESGNKPSEDVDNRELEGQTDGPINYAMEKHDSAEVVLPAQPGEDPKTVHIEHKQKFEVQEKEGGNFVPSEISDDQSGHKPSEDVDNRELEGQTEGPINYAMEKHDSAEVVLPAQPGEHPKTVHIEHKQKFEVQEKEGGNSVPSEITDDQNGKKPSEDVDNRELEGPTDGPINYAMEKHDSAEVVLPAQPGEDPKTVHIEHKQKFEVQEKEGGNSEPSEITDDQSGKKPSEDVDNREMEGPTDGPINYAMEKHDSAEVVLPAEPGKAPKTVHIEYKQKFEVQEKEGGNSRPNEISDDESGNKPSEDVDNRELEGQTDGPINYAMEKHDSAEVVLPAQPGEDPKTVHIEHKQKFEVQEKEGGNFVPSEISDDQSGHKPSEDVDNRELEGQTEGPINYAMEKHDSAEVVLPAQPGEHPKTVHIEHKQMFEVQEKEGGNSVPSEISDDQSGHKPSEDVDNRELEGQTEGPINYAMEKHDSAEVVLPAQPGEHPKTVHIEHKQKFEVQEKEGGNSVPFEISDDQSGNKPTDDVDNRELEGPTEGPINYAMEKHDSAEVVLPAQPGEDPKTVHIEHKQKFEVQEKEGGNSVPSEISDNQSGNKQSENVDDRELVGSTDGPINYAMEKHDSAEVVLPAQPGEDPKTVHIEHKQKFEVQEKEGGNSVPSEISDNQSGNKPSENVDDRELVGSTDGPINYAMEKHDSAEVVLPAQPGEGPKTVHIEHKQKFEVQEKEGGNVPPSEYSGDENGIISNSEIEDRNLDAPSDGGPIHYAMEKHDSAEVVLPGESGAPPKTVHIEFKQNFEVQQKAGDNSPLPEDSADENGIQYNSEIDTNSNTPSDSPRNYAMEKHDSAEVVLPAKAGEPSKTVHLDSVQTFNVQEKESAAGNVIAPEQTDSSDDKSPADDQDPSVVENRDLDESPPNGPLNYAMDRQESAEVQLPLKDGLQPKTVHINFKEKFIFDEKGKSSNSEVPSPPIVENRELESDKEGGPQNYAMEKHDSAEVKLPNENGEPSKTVHLDFKENFKLEHKESDAITEIKDKDSLRTNVSVQNATVSHSNVTGTHVL